MSSNASVKIRTIRETAGLDRKAFSELIGISQRTLEGIENKGSDPASSVLQSVCREFPQYTFWLTLDRIETEIGQISPELEEIRAELKQTGMDTQ